MPVHNWKRVDANLFHHFHQMWTGRICDALNDGLLPKGYSAFIEQHSGGAIPDVLALERRTLSDKRTSPTGGAVVTEKPKTRHVIQSAKIALAQRANRITIYHPLGEVVCVIEIVSPGNKSGKLAFTQFVEKSVALLQHGIHLLVVDLFPPTARDPEGMHKAIWDEIDDEAPFELPPNQPLTLAAYSAGDPLADVPTTAYVETIAVGEPLPDMPAYLDQDSFVPVPLEATYQLTWQRCPEIMRTFVETGALPQE